MRRFFEAVARALRARREMAVALATAIVAATLIVSGQGNLAAVVTMGTAGVMAGRAEKSRLEARDARRQVTEQAERLATEAERHRLEVGSWRRRLAALVKETREHLSYLERNATSYEWYALHLRWEIKRAEERLARTGLLSEQTQLVDILPPEEADKFYSDAEEVNTTDTAAEE